MLCVCLCVCVFVCFSLGVSHTWYIHSLTPRAITPAPYTPKILCVNRKSGSTQGAALAQWFASRFAEDEVLVVRLGEVSYNPADTSNKHAAAAAEMIQRWTCHSDGMGAAAREIRLLVAGGDGTVSWALSTLEGILLPLGLQVPPMILIPLGTGNELSNCLGWGDGSSGSGGPFMAVPSVCKPCVSGQSSLALRPEVERVIQAAVQGRVETLDRWEVDVWGNGANNSKGTEPSVITPMLCFCSVGFDAHISHQFSLWRDKRPALFSSQLINKIGYTYLGAQCMLSPPPTIAGRVALEIDGVSVALPATLRSVQVFNVHGSSDGVDFFGCGQSSVEGELQTYSAPSNDDGLLEVVGTEGVPQLMYAKMGCTHSHRLGQGRVIRITILTPASDLVAQIDGESWVPQGAGSMEIRHVGKVHVIVGPSGRYPKKF